MSVGGLLRAPLGLRGMFGGVEESWAHDDQDSRGAEVVSCEEGRALDASSVDFGAKNAFPTQGLDRVARSLVRLTQEQGFGNDV